MFYARGHQIIFTVILLLCSFYSFGQCPGSSCTFSVNGADGGTYTITAGQTLCLASAAVFTGTVNLYGGTLQNCATNAQTFTLNTNSGSPNAILENYGIIDFTPTTTFQDALVVNNHHTITINGNWNIWLGAIYNNFGLTTVSGQIDNHNEINNYGTLTVGTSISDTGSGILTNTGEINANNWTVSGQYDNSGVINISNNCVFNSSSIGTISGGCLNCHNWTNRGDVTGTTCGNINITNTSEQTSSGSLLGNIAIIDATPPGSAPFIDTNNGSIGPNIVWSSCSTCSLISEEICGNSVDDNNDGRVDEPYPGGVQTEMQLWLKAETGTNTTTNGNDVTAWTDQSVNGYSANADVNSTDDPTFSENAINFNPGIEFDGTYTDDFSDGLHLGADYIYSDQEGVRIFTVVSPDNSGGQYDMIYDFGGTVSDGYGVSWNNVITRFKTPSGYGGTTTFNLHSTGTEPSLLLFEIDFNDEQALYKDGSLLLNSAIPSLNQLTDTEINQSDHYGTAANGDDLEGPVSIGRTSASQYISSDRIFDGKISEVLVYNDTLSQSDEEKINSYLAIKYGITLNHDYISSSGNLNKDVSDGYANVIAGIGRDDCSGLHQKQSKSVESEAIVTIGMGSVATTNIQNGTSIGVDETYLVWGNDGVAANASWNSANVNIAGGDYSRIDRVWRFTETLNILNTALQVEVDNPNFDLPAMLPTADGDYYLLQDDDGDFTNGGSTATPMSLVSGDVWEAIISDPTSGYYSFGISEDLCGAQSPVLTKQ